METTDFSSQHEIGISSNDPFVANHSFELTKGNIPESNHVTFARRRCVIFRIHFSPNIGYYVGWRGGKCTTGQNQQIRFRPITGSPIVDWHVCVYACVCVRVFHKARNTWNMFMEHSFRAYLYIDTWSWSSSVARSVILIPFKLTARETRCSFLPLAFAYWREKKNIVKSFLVKMREGNDWSVFNFWNILRLRDKICFEI